MSTFIESMYEKRAFIYKIEGSFYAIGQSVFEPITDKAEIDNVILFDNALEKNNEKQVTKYADKIRRIANSYRVDATAFLKTREKLFNFLTKLEQENPEEFKKLQERVQLIEEK